MEDTVNDSLLSEALSDKQGWDEYWNKKENGDLLYSYVAEFYRKVIIRPTLNYFINHYFAPGSKLLHAGCGSGQVDVDISPKFDITGLDISRRALEIYKESNHNHCHTVHASIFDIRLPDKSMDGIYNLGVMEHFTVEEIGKILEQFRRVLKDDGKLVLFWPPEYGLSVLFFKTLKKTIHLFSGKDVKFHPDEISRVQSKKSVEKIMNDAGFKMLRYSFGPRDVWTYSIIVAAKN